MALTKLELQQMLREMNVKFEADETYDELKQRLQQEHHRLWLKSISGGRPDRESAAKKVIKRRKKTPTGQEPATQSVIPSTDPPKSARRSSTGAPSRNHQFESNYRSRQIEKPDPGKPWKEAAAGTEPFNRKKKVFESVLKRASGCCERCRLPSDETSGAKGLQPFHIDPLSQGGEHSIKNVVALCPDCLLIVQNDPNLKEIKDLKRRTRCKLYDSLEVVRRKAGGRRRQGPWKRR